MDVRMHKFPINILIFYWCMHTFHVFMGVCIKFMYLLVYAFSHILIFYRKVFGYTCIPLPSFLPHHSETKFFVFSNKTNRAVFKLVPSAAFHAFSSIYLAPQCCHYHPPFSVYSIYIRVSFLIS